MFFASRTTFYVFPDSIACFIILFSLSNQLVVQYKNISYETMFPLKVSCSRGAFGRLIVLSRNCTRIPSATSQEVRSLYRQVVSIPIPSVMGTNASRSSNLHTSALGRQGGHYMYLTIVQLFYASLHCRPSIQCIIVAIQIND